MSAQLAARRDEVSGLLGIIQTIETSPPPVLMVHPSGPLGAARSAMMLAEVTPALHARAQELKADLEEVQSLRLLQQSAARTLEEGLSGVQAARVQLSTAIADRTSLPRRFTADPVRTAILISSTETLSGFADGLADIAEGEIAASSADISDLRGTLPLRSKGWFCAATANGMRPALPSGVAGGGASTGAGHRADGGHHPLSRAASGPGQRGDSGTAAGHAVHLFRSGRGLWRGGGGDSGGHPRRADERRKSQAGRNSFTKR